MRSTFTQLQSEAHGLTQTKVTDTSVNTFLKSEINNAQRIVYARLREFISQKTSITTTVVGQQFYFLPVDLKHIESVTITINSVLYNLTPIDNFMEWNRLNAVDFSGGAFPQKYFVKRNSVGIWPKPQGEYTMSIVYNYKLKDMTAEDYITGTVAVTNGSQLLTGSGTTFTAAMVGRWLGITTDGYWYELNEFTDTTHMNLYNYFQGITGSSLTYVIGESPYIPEEAHELLPYKAAAQYFATRKKNADQAQILNNYFWTGDYNNKSRKVSDSIAGGLLGLIRDYSKNENSGVVRRNRTDDNLTPIVWAERISS